MDRAHHLSTLGSRHAGSKKQPIELDALVTKWVALVAPIKALIRGSMRGSSSILLTVGSSGRGNEATLGRLAGARAGTTTGTPSFGAAQVHGFRQTPSVIIRREHSADAQRVHEIQRLAFARPDLDHGEPPPEVALLAALRADPGWIDQLSLVAEVDGRAAGHAVCTRGRIDEQPAVALGPIGVDPDLQRQGVGHALMHAIIGAADALGEPLIALLGSTDYYPRFGFVPSTTLGIDPPEPLWGDFFQVRTLTSYDASISGTFRYAAPFDDLD